MFRKNEKKIGDANTFVCTKLAIISSSREAYCDPAYFVSAAATLNTGEEKHVFTNKSSAEQFLNKRGTTWCLYELLVPQNTIISDGKQISVNKRHIFSEDNIVAMSFHPLFSHERIINRNPDSESVSKQF